MYIIFTRTRMKGPYLVEQCGGLAQGMVARMSSAKKARVILISGPTAVGKSRVALALAKRLDGEIVSADSVQVYRGLDVGSAKTPLNERQGVPHHLIDIVDPTDEYTAGAFYDDARQATSQVIVNGRVPIVVGGTGLYLRWYLNGKPGTPKETPEISALVDEEVSLLQSSGDWDSAIQLLGKAGDTRTAQSLARNDWYRLRRALAIIKATGLPRSHFPHVGKIVGENEAPLEACGSSEIADDYLHSGNCDYEFLCYFLHNRRLDLYRAIDLRCEEMLAAGIWHLFELGLARQQLHEIDFLNVENLETGGFLAEASWLLDLGIQPGSSPPSRAIGYRQAMEYLSECRSAGGKTSEEHFMKFLCSFQQASRNYAKRQLTWFRGEPLFQWIDASQPVEKIVEFLVDEFHKPAGLSIESRVLLAPQVIAKREHALLNAYQAENKIFVNSSACTPILDWIERTQAVRSCREEEVET